MQQKRIMDTDNTEDGIEYLEEPMISLTKLIAQYGMDEVTEAMSMVELYAPELETQVGPHKPEPEI